MTDEELKKIVEEAIGNDDPFWNEPIFEIVKKIIEMPDGTESSIAKLLSDNIYTYKQIFDIYESVNDVCNKINITIDFSRENAQIGRLLYNLPFIKKALNDSNEVSYKFYKKNEDDKIWWVENTDKIGEHLFSFDQVKVYNLFKDYPYKLSKEEIEIFNNENEYWANFFKDR